MPTPDQPVHWLDQGGNQIGPEPFATVVQRVHSGQIPASTPLWWDGAPGWTPFDQVPQAAAAPTPATAPPPAATAAATASDALMDGLTDQELDDEFMGLVNRSWEMFKETELATSIDETMLGGVITALVDCGFVLIDLNTAGPAAVNTTTTTTATTVDASTTASAGHELRFEEPSSGARVTVAIEHLTPDPAAARLVGHRAAAVIGYGERVPNFSQVGQAVRQEVQSTLVVSPEPGTVTFDADISSGYVYAQIDLLWELDRYVSDDLSVDHDLLRRHLAAVIHTMRTFVRTRFAG